MNCNNKTINGLIEIDSDYVVSDYYNDVNGNQLIYLQNVRSDIQQQIDNCNMSISGSTINYNYLQSEINTISGTLNNYIISNNNIVQYQNLYMYSISSYIYSYNTINNNINNIQNLYLTSLSSSISTINNLNNYQNLYMSSISSYIISYNNNNNNINNYQNLYINSLSGTLNNYIISNNNINNYQNLYLVSLSNSILSLNNYIYNSISGYLYYYNQTVNYSNITYGYMNQSLSYRNNCYDYTNTCNLDVTYCNNLKDETIINKNEAIDAKNSAVDAKNSANASAGASAGSAAASGASAGASAGFATSAAASASEAAAYVATFNSTYGPRIEVVEGKCQYQNVILGVTDFSSDVSVSNGPIIVELKKTDRSLFSLGIDAESGSITNGINNSNGINNTGGIISDSISIDSGKLAIKKNTVNQISYNSVGSTSVRDAGIEFIAPLFNPYLLSDTGTMNLRAFNVNIGNADQSSVVYINGTVYFSNPLNMSNFINQFA